MKRPKIEPSVARRFRLQHLLFALAALYLVFISVKFPQFLEIAKAMSGDDGHVGLDLAEVQDSQDGDLSKPLFSSVYKDTFHRKLEDQSQDAPVRPSKEPLEEKKSESKPIRPLQHRYGRITGEILRQMNRTNELSVLERMADEAWTLGLNAWEEVDKHDGKETEEGSIVEGKPESCPSWLSMSGQELAMGDKLMFLPCGLAAGSSVTVVGTSHYAHQEYVPQLAKLRRGDGTVLVSQFMVELQGLKSVDGEDPPKILHLNPRLKGDWSQRPVIEHNTCYRMQWGSAQRCDGLTSKNNEDMLVDGYGRCEKWMRNDMVDSKESRTKTTSWFKRFIGREQKPEVTWPFPFTEGRLFILTIRAGVDGFHISVGGRHVTSFPYRTGFTLEDATGLAIKGDVDVHSVMLLLFPLLIRVSHLKEYWRCQRSGKLVLYLRVLFGYLLAFFLLQITLQSAWQ
ncbi:hydroxyproline O-galactosyltransferase GALT2 [Prunus yedoensis var. nudiflora]|uniref:Galectin n=1 Tax=Prunus yedoensis var. nudiflora TaxID=2094558 RepID=A0A314V4P8_PRUYE|nr:hydroxyproline O-galactosyltransferase GALT2 [Prunus yedoensis var. nudiflora]